MKRKIAIKKRQAREMTAADVGRFLKNLSSSFKDAKYGNPALSEALWALSIVLMDEKYARVKPAAEKFMSGGGFDFDDGIDFSDLNAEKVTSALGDKSLTRAHLVILGVERFGIARSRLEKLPREEIVKIITSALDHEKSLEIISEEAQRGGRARTS